MQTLLVALAEAEARAHAAEAARDALLASTSWRLTRPLRVMARLTGRGRAAPPTAETAPDQEAGVIATEATPSDPDAAEAPDPQPGEGVEQEMAAPPDPDPSPVTLPAAELDDGPLDLEALTAGRFLSETVGGTTGEVSADRARAMRWVLDALLPDPALRTRFPTALHDGPDGPFAAWLLERASEAEMSDEGRSAVLSLLEDDPATPVRDLFLRSEETRSRFPLGLLPGHRGGYTRTLLADPGAYGLMREEVEWFVVRAAERPAEGMVTTVLFTRDWLRRFPDGLTVFGWPALAQWLGTTKGLPDAALPEIPPIELPPIEALRLAYHARPGWRERHPDALLRADAARDLLRNLVAAPDLTAMARAWCAERLADGTAEAITRPGLNVIGHFRYPSGLRRSVETLCEGVTAAGLPITRRDLRADPADDAGREAFAGLEVHDITLIHVQPEPFFPVAYARADLAERRPRTYRIGYWYWETDTAPASWADIADGVDEAWAATEFVATALRRVVSVPVFTLPPGVSMPPFTPRPREHFGLRPASDGRFVFLFVFHLSSVMERKNPLGLVAAFRAAFAPEEPVDLVLKVTSFDRHNAAPEALRDAAAGLNVQVLDATLPTGDVLALIAACDAYISLHRSEGLGLTMAEAMLLGRPVIASRTSGNLDFMDDGNALLVDGTPVPVGPGVPPYDPDALWFDPSVEMAARHMRRLYEDRAFAADLGARGRRDAEARLSPTAAGERIASRVRAIAAARCTRPAA